VVLETAGDELQKLVHTLNKTAQGHTFKTPSKKTTARVFKGKKPAGPKIASDHHQLSRMRYLL
jgi:hypothetical protein